MSAVIAAWLVAGGLGACAGLLDLIKSCPPAKSALRTWWGRFYILLSAGFSLAALWLYVVLGFPLPQTAVSPEWIPVLLIGIFGLGLLRSTITFQLWGKPLPVDINKLPQSVLDAIKKATKDAQQGIDDSDVGKIMQGVSFAKSFEQLPTYCIRRADESMSPEVARTISDYVNVLRTDPLTDQLKATLMGLKLAGIVGNDALKRAVAALGTNIRDDPKVADVTTVASAAPQPAR